MSQIFYSGDIHWRQRQLNRKKPIGRGEILLSICSFIAFGGTSVLKASISEIIFKNCNCLDVCKSGQVFICLPIKSKNFQGTKK